MTFASRHQELAPSWRETISAGSERDLPQDTAKPGSDAGGSASVVVYLRKGKKTVQQQLERGVRICERSSPADTKDREEGGEEVFQVLEQRLPCSPW